jgi:hypothetical protein
LFVLPDALCIVQDPIRKSPLSGASHCQTRSGILQRRSWEKQTRTWTRELPLSRTMRRHVVPTTCSRQILRHRICLDKGNRPRRNAGRMCRLPNRGAALSGEFLALYTFSACQPQVIHFPLEDDDSRRVGAQQDGG